MRFIRKNGRIIPIKDGSGAPAASKKRYPTIKKASTGAIVSGTAVGSVAGAFLFKSPMAIIASGLLTGLAAAGTVTSKKAKGESDKHLAGRISNYQNSRKFRK